MVYNNICHYENIIPHSKIFVGISFRNIYTMPLSSGARVSSFIRKSETLSSRLQLPERLKGGRIERYANRHNPDEKSFNDLLVKVNNDLTMVSELCRNNTSMQHQFEIVRAQNAGVPRHWNLGLFSIIWRDNYNTDFGHVKAKCKYLTVGYTDILFNERERIVDVGFLDNWWFTNKAMEEYDVNQDEWDESGNPIDTKDQLKPLW